MGEHVCEVQEGGAGVAELVDEGGGEGEGGGGGGSEEVFDVGEGEEIHVGSVVCDVVEMLYLFLLFERCVDELSSFILGVIAVMCSDGVRSMK